MLHRTPPFQQSFAPTFLTALPGDLPVGAGVRYPDSLLPEGWSVLPSPESILAAVGGTSLSVLDFSGASVERYGLFFALGAAGAVLFVWWERFSAERSIAPVAQRASWRAWIGRFVTRWRNRSWAQAFAGSQEAIILWELNGAGIIHWNRAATELYGFTEREAIGRSTHQLLSTELLGGVAALEEHLDRYGIFVGQLQHVTRGGRRITVEARLTLISQHNGRWLVLEVNRDVTALLAAEAAGEARLEGLAEIRHLRTPARD